MMLASHKKIISMMTTASILIVSVLSTVGNIYAQTPPPLEAPPTSDTPSPAPVEKNNNDSAPPNNDNILISGKVTIPITSTTQIIIDLPIKPDSKIEIVPIK